MSAPGLRLVHSQESADIDVLVGRVARGDSEAFDQLYDAVSAPVYGLARRVVRDPTRSEDVTQEVFLEVWRKAARFDPNLGRAKTWIMTIAHRRAVDAVRRTESQKRQDHHGAPDEVSHDEPADAVIKDEEHGAVRECLETLPSCSWSRSASRTSTATRTARWRPCWRSHYRRSRRECETG